MAVSAKEIRSAKRPPKMGHGPDSIVMGEKAKDFKGTLKILLKYLKPFHAKLAVIIIFAALSTVFNILSPKVLALATNELAAGVVKLLNSEGNSPLPSKTNLFSRTRSKISLTPSPLRSPGSSYISGSLTVISKL